MAAKSGGYSSIPWWACFSPGSVLAHSSALLTHGKGKVEE